MSEKDNNKLKHNHREKSMKVPFVIQTDTKHLLEKIGTCQKNPEKLVKSKVNTHTTCSYLLFTHCSLDTTKNKHNYYKGEDCMENFCKDLKEQAKKITACEKNDTIN